MALGFSSALGHSGAELARGLVVVGYDDSAVDRGLARTEGTLKKGTGLFSRLALGVGIVGIAATAMGLKFEHSLKRTQALVGVSTEQMGEYRDAILHLSTETGKSTSELADALYFIASSGLQGKDAIDALTASAKASAAGLGETMVIADAVTSAVNAYGKANLSAAQATDILLTAVRVGKNEPEELSRAIGSSIGLAQKMGVEFSEVASTIATYSLAGNTARMATFGLNAVLTTFLKPTKQTADALKDIGTNAQEVANSISQDGLTKTLMDLSDAVDGNRVKLAQIFPNVRALRLVLGLTGETAKAAASNLDAVTNSAGETDKAFNIVAQDTQAKLHKAFNALMAVTTRLGLLLVPLVNVIATVFLKLAKAIDHNMGVVNALAKVLGIAVAAWLAYKGVLVTVAVWQAVKMPLAIAATTASMIVQNGVIGTLRIAWASLTAVMAANPIGAIVVALTLLVTGLIYAYKHSETFRRVVAASFKYAADAAALALKVITFQIRLFLKGLGYLADAASHLPIIGDKFKGVKEKIDGVVDSLDRAIQYVDDLGEKDVNVKVKVTYDFAPFTGPNPLEPPAPPPTTKKQPQFGEPGWKPLPSTQKPSGGGGAAGGTRSFEIPAVLAMRRLDAANDAQMIRAIQGEIAFLNWVKRTRDLTAKEMLQVRTDIKSREDEIAGIRKQAIQDQRDARDKAVQAEQDAIAEAVKLPERIAQGQARAEQLGKKAPMLRWARAEVKFLLGLINSHKYHGAVLTDLYTRLGAAKKKVSDIRNKNKDKTTEDPTELPDEIVVGQARARAMTPKSKADDLKWAKREVAFLLGLINSHKYQGKVLADLYDRLYDARQNVIDLREQAVKDAEAQNRASMSAQQQWAFLNTRAQFFDQFGSNVFRMGSAGAAATPGAPLSSIQAPQQTTINVNQTFPAPTPDKHREARYARAAVKAAFD